MTIRELCDTLTKMRENCAYSMWKQAYLFGLTFGKDFPKSPKDACPELIPKKSVPMPDFLKQKWERRENG